MFAGQNGRQVPVGADPCRLNIADGGTHVTKIVIGWCHEMSVGRRIEECPI